MALKQGTTTKTLPELSLGALLTQWVNKASGRSEFRVNAIGEEMYARLDMLPPYDEVDNALGYMEGVLERQRARGNEQTLFEVEAVIGVLERLRATVKEVN